jgi:hypothetical protein
MNKIETNYYQTTTEAPVDTAQNGVKIEKLNPEESTFYGQPKKRIDSNEVYNLALIRSALNQLDDVVTIDSMLHARIVNVITILQGIEKDQVEKINLV